MTHDVVSGNTRDQLQLLVFLRDNGRRTGIGEPRFAAELLRAPAQLRSSSAALAPGTVVSANFHPLPFSTDCVELLPFRRSEGLGRCDHTARATPCFYQRPPSAAASVFFGGSSCVANPSPESIALLRQRPRSLQPVVATPII